MRQRNTLVECGFGIVSTARLGCKLGHVWTASRMQTCLVLQTLVRREAVWGNCPWINVPECWRRLVLCGGPWMTNMKSLSQIQTACQLLPGTRLVAKSKLGRLRQFENTWHGAEPNWQIAATTWWHEKWHMQIRDQHWQVLRPTWPKGWCQGLHSLKPMKDHRSHDAWSGGFSSGHGHKIRVTVIKWKFGWGCDLQLGIFHSHIWLAEGQHFDPSNHKKIIRSDQCHIRQVPAAISTMLHGSNFSKLSRAIQRQWWLYDCDPFFSTWNSMWLWTCHYIDGFASNSDEGKKKDIERNEKKVMTRKQLHIVCLSFHCVFLAPLNTFRDMCAAAFFKFIAWSTPVAMEISGLSVLVGAIGQTRKNMKKPCSRNHHIQTHSIRIF